MALDNRLVVYNEQGEPVDYDILASDVKFLPDGKDLPTKLAELEDEAGQGGYAPPQDGIPKTDLAQSVQDSLDKADSALQDEDLADYATKTELQQGLGGKQDTINDLASIRTGAGKGATAVQSVTVESEEDGTVDIHVDDDTYSINLNHTHENMAKLEKHTPATMPDVEDMEDDTLYAEIEDGEVNVLYIGGIPFYGGGGAVSGPVLRRPADGSTIDMGETVNGSVSKTINVKGKNLTQVLTIELDGTGYTFGNQQPSGVTIVSTTELTITAGAANVLNGVDIVVVYTGNDTDENASGTLSITSNDNISVEATLVANKVTYEDLAGVKLTGTQWLQTDYYPNPNTEFVLDFKLSNNTNSTIDNGTSQLMRTGYTSEYNDRFAFYHGGGNNRFHFFSITAQGQSPAPVDINMNDKQSDMLADHATLTFVKGQSGATLTFKGGSTERSTNVPAVGATAQTPMNIGYNPTNQIIYYCFDLTIYGLTITENGVTVRHWVPKKKNGVPGIYDTVAGSFISSETSTPLVAVELT